MNYEVNKTVKVVLNLTQEELNTIVCAFGASTDNFRAEIASVNNLKNLSDRESGLLYSKLKDIAMSINN